VFELIFLKTYGHFGINLYPWNQYFGDFDPFRVGCQVYSVRFYHINEIRQGLFFHNWDGFKVSHHAVC
jgi:hypothetical protein